MNWNIIEGEHALMPGLDLILTRGHRPGNQSAVVRLPKIGLKILVGDVVDLIENFDREILGSSIDDTAGFASLMRLKRLASDVGAELVPLHDPEFVQTARLAPLYYD